MRGVLILLSVILLVGMVSATTTISSTPVLLNQDSTILTLHYTIDNTNGNAGAKGVEITGLPSFLSYSGGSISYAENTTTSGDLNIIFNIPEDVVGNFENYIIIDGETLTIPISISEPEITEGCRLIELPHTTTYRIKQGEVGASSQIRIKVSSECPSAMNGMTVTEQTQMSKPMYLQGSSGDIEPGSEFAFTIGLDAEGVSTGSYQNTYIVSGSVGDEIYQKSISLSTIVTIGTSPIDENSFENLPSCTLDSDMELNQTYSLICTNDNPNINIEVPYNDFFMGTSVEESEGKLEYSFIPVKTGLTSISALFKYKTFVIGNPFIKEIRVTAGSIPIQGTTLEILFYQNGEKIEVNSLLPLDTTVLVKDNNTGSIVPSFTIYLNGNNVNNTFKLEAEKDYELIFDSTGYLTSTINININQTPLDILVSPEKEFYIVGDQVNITSNQENVTFLLDDYIIDSLYSFISEGEKVLSVVKEGYISFNKTIKVNKKVLLSTSSPIYEEWKKGEIIAELNTNASWEIYHDNVLIKAGEGQRVEFKIEDYGLWEIKSNGNSVISKNIEERGWFDWIDFAWYWWFIVLASILAGYYLFFQNKESPESEMMFQPTQ